MTIPENLNHILAPCKAEDFFNSYYEKDILYIARNDAHYYNAILTDREISDYLDRQDIFYPSVRMVKDGKELPGADYTLKGVPIGHHKKDGIIDTAKMFSLFNNGATLVIQAGQRYFEHLSFCCFDLSKLFNAPVQANLYITPVQSQGFNPHWDTHDVFVLQISGTKTWRLYGMEMELPVKSQPFVSKDYNKEPLHTLQLQPGDFLYVPRGYVHDAVADDGVSAHITIGILSYTWARLFSDALTTLEQYKEMREAIPFWRDDLDQMTMLKKALLNKIVDALDIDKTVDKLTQQYRKIQPQPVQQYFSSLLRVKDVTATTMVQLNEGIFCDISIGGEALAISCLGKTVQLPITAKPVLDYMISNKQARINDLPGEMEANILWVQQLIREGIVYISGI